MKYNTLKQLVELANLLDKRGLFSEANQIDFVIKLAGSLRDEYHNEKLEGTNFTYAEFNKLIDRYLETGDENVKVEISGQGADERVTLKFPSGPDVVLTGDEWDKLQVSVGIM